MTMIVYWTATASQFLIVLLLSAVTMDVVTIVSLITVSCQMYKASKSSPEQNKGMACSSRNE